MPSIRFASVSEDELIPAIFLYVKSSPFSPLISLTVSRLLFYMSEKV
jgi:hypothetical protein